ncbi:helix-turn-helix domain-containing protein [Paenibacillus sp. 2TAB23]|uniref:helix-turn-helix domain-containing protein n=1 Tax=Paenibacillus sp. 2TAB23 TaxID=3233004 RepID=UPI003F9D3E0C
MNIQSEFGLRCKQLRARSGMSQETLAFKSGLDRTYVSSIERGERNVSLLSMVKIAAAFHVSLSYIFSLERLSDNQAYQPHDFNEPLSEKFKYIIDYDNRILSFQINGLLNKTHTDQMTKTWFNLSSLMGGKEAKVFFDYRNMRASDNEPAVFSPEVLEKAVEFQEQLNQNFSQIVVLCNSEYMVHQMNYVASLSSAPNRSVHLFGSDQDMAEHAYRLLGVNGNELIKFAV